ncbi:MAG: SdpI family protein [Eubacteriales bacterium]|jgi:uncharacterized membrane protein
MRQSVIHWLKQEWLYLLLCLVNTLVFFWLYPRLPQMVPNSIGFSGQIQSYASKSITWLTAAIPWLTLLGFSLLPLLDPLRNNYRRFSNIYFLLKGLAVILVIALHNTMIMLAFYPNLHQRFPSIIMAILSLMCLTMGNYMPSVKRNFYIGFRTPWALLSEENWDRTHRLGGRLMMICGVAALLMALLNWPIASFVGVMTGALLPCAYSFWLFSRGI